MTHCISYCASLVSFNWECPLQTTRWGQRLGCLRSKSCSKEKKGDELGKGDWGQIKGTSGAKLIWGQRKPLKVFKSDQWKQCFGEAHLTTGHRMDWSWESLQGRYVGNGGLRLCLLALLSLTHSFFSEKVVLPLPLLLSFWLYVPWCSVSLSLLSFWPSLHLSFLQLLYLKCGTVESEFGVFVRKEGTPQTQEGTREYIWLGFSR